MISYHEVLSKVQSELKGENYRVLQSYHKRKYDFEQDLELWEVHTKIIDQHEELIPITLWIQFPADFPVVFPKVYICKADYQKFEYAPHIERDGKICLFTNHAQPNMELPTMVLKSALNRARSVLEDALGEIASETYAEEFESYWSQTYSKNDKITHNMLIVTEAVLQDSAWALVLNTPTRGFKYIVYNEEEDIVNYKSFLKKLSFKFEETPVFVFGALPFFEKPPFHLTNSQIRTNLKAFDESEYHRFVEFFKKYQEPRIFIFQKIINDRIRYFGWKHQPLQKVDRFRVQKFNKDFETLCFVQPSKPISRIYPQVYSISRLLERSSGQLNKDMAPTYTVAGLGSIGSYLIHFMDGPGVNFNLIDQEHLSLENTGRHLLGFQYVHQLKTEAMQEYLLTRYPLRSIETESQSILHVIKNNPDLINHSQALFVCIGEYNKEAMIAQALADKIINVPVLVIWVEPYLLAGHCMYLNPENPDYKKFHKEGSFKQSIIKDYSDERLTKQEAGCQSIYTPYAPNAIRYFLGALAPHINCILKNPKTHPTQVLTWIGDVKIAEELEIELRPATQLYTFGQIITIEA